MKERLKLREFCKDVITYIGSGYKYFKIVHIPNDKLFKKHEILLKVSNHYRTNLSRGMRHKGRLKNIANYGAVYFKNTLIILRTSGEHQDGEKEFSEIPKNLEIKFSEHLTLILFKDERGKFTWRLSRETFRFFRGEFEIAFKNRDGKKFHNLNHLWGGLPRYIGIGKQKRELNKMFLEWSKKYKVKWNLFPNFEEGTTRLH
jgi:hypothetical protein